eukprot:15361955-Ditylum_brightwellii.AAC.1
MSLPAAQVKKMMMAGKDFQTQAMREVAEARRNQVLASLASIVGTDVTCMATQMAETTRNNAAAPMIMLQLIWEQ